MKNIPTITEIDGILGLCGSQEVFLGFAPAHLLNSISFADVLNEDTGEGYQRPYAKRHSLSFRQYISRERSSTIPLTFNLRPELKHAWELNRDKDGRAVLRVSKGHICFSRVDCQHRLGELDHSNIPLAFMTFIGLDIKTERVHLKSPGAIQAARFLRGAFREAFNVGCGTSPANQSKASSSFLLSM